MAETSPAAQDAPEQAPERKEPEAKGAGLGVPARMAIIALVTFLVFFLIDGRFFANDFLAEHFSVSPLFAFAPIVCLYLGWPAMVGCVVAESIVCLSTGVTIFDPGIWVAGLIFYVVIPYLLWYATNASARDPYPRCSRAGALAKLFWILILANIVYAIFASISAVQMNVANGYAWSVLSEFLMMTSITLTLGIVLLIALEASPLAPLPASWITVPYRQRRSLSLTQRIVLVFAALATVVLLGLILSFYVFIYSEEEGGAESIVELITASLVLGDVVIIVLWTFGVLVIRYLQTRFTIPIERLSETTRAFPRQMADYQTAVDEGVRGEALAEARAEAEDPVDMGDLKPSGEVAYLVEDTDTMRASMVRYLDEMRSVTAENERVKAELEIAKGIQQSAVPHDFTELESELGVQIAASMTPARDVGGDFYDAFMIDATHLGVIMADVSGKGMPAALFMMRALADLREQMHSHAEDVGLALTRANQALCENNGGNLFVTAFIGILDVKTGVFSYANGGHNPAWILGTDGTWLKARKGLVIGIMDMIQYKTETLQLEPGGGLFLYTDGVTEAMNPEDALYGEDRLDAILKKTEAADDGEAPSEVIVQNVLTDVHAFVDGAEPSDDLTAMAFRWLPN